MIRTKWDIQSKYFRVMKIRENNTKMHTLLKGGKSDMGDTLRKVNWERNKDNSYEKTTKKCKLTEVKENSKSKQKKVYPN